MSSMADPKQRSFGVVLVAAVIVLVAVGARLHRLREWPIHYAVPVQYESAITARVFWLSLGRHPLSAGQQKWLDARPQNVTAPPAMQVLLAAAYWLIGQEQPWLSIVFASLFWLAGGWFLFDLCRRLTGGTLGALAALAFYLFNPIGVLVSRSFQPEALMTFGFLAALWCLVRFDAVSRFRTTVIVGLLGGVAVLAKPGFCLLPLLAAYLVLAWKARGARRTLLSPHLYVFGVLVCLPSLLYAFLFLQAHVSQKLVPRLLLWPMFYYYWFGQIDVSIGWLPLLAGLFGACVMVRTHDSPLGLGLLAGYLGYSMTFTWHSMTHSYYQVPLVPILALCLAPLADLLLRGVPWGRLSRPSQGVGLLLLAASGLLYASPALRFDRSAKVQEIARVSREIGTRLGYGTKVICLVEEYDDPLRYHGWLLTSPWPYLGDKGHQRITTGTVVEDRGRLRKLIAQSGAPYFVITNFDELNGQPDLARLLASHFPVYYRDDRVLIYDLRKPLRPLTESPLAAER